MSLKKLFLFLILTTQFFPQEKIDGIVAIVGNNIVLHSDVLQQAQIIAASTGIDPLKHKYVFSELYSSSLDNMVNQLAILDVAEKDTNLIVSDDEVDRALDQRVEEFIIQAGSEEAFEKLVGMSMRQVRSEYWQEIRKMIYIEKYKFSLINEVDVSRVEVNLFYIDYQDSIPIVPEQFDFSVIEIPFISGKSSENNIYMFLDSLRSLVLFDGASFDSLAIRYSQDPGTSSSGGYLGFTSRGSLVLPYEEAAYTLGVGEISPPVRSQFGYHLIRLIERRGEKISSQHILMPVAFSDKDMENSLERARFIYDFSVNDPFVFDSLAIESSKLDNNLSGTYSNFSPNEISPIILKNLNLLNQKGFSDPIKTKEGYILIALYKHHEEYFPNLENSWNLINNYAKHEKQNSFFLEIVEKVKNKTFIKILYN